MLLPMYFLIGRWGGPEKTYAAMKFFLYTFSGSILILFTIIYLGLDLSGEDGLISFDLELMSKISNEKYNFSNSEMSGTSLRIIAFWLISIG
jgi:NADH-quinone oxidoreductase subunit M